MISKDFKPPKPGETMQDYVERVHFEQDDDGWWWCSQCATLVRGRDWLCQHYESAHGLFHGF